MAAYVAKGTDPDTALAALTYATAYPFLTPDVADQPLPFELRKYRDLFAVYQRLKLSRPRWKGLPYRLLGVDKRASRKILELTGGDDYEVVCTVPAGAAKPPGFTVIGEVLAGEGMEVRAAGRALDAGAGGWRHL